MNFQPELARKVMAGEKTVTRRLVRDNPRSPWAASGCKLKVGRDYAVCPGRGKHAIGRARIVSVGLERLRWITDDEAQREGFATARDFHHAFAEINGTHGAGEYVWRVEFAVVTSTTSDTEILVGPLGADLEPYAGAQPGSEGVVEADLLVRELAEDLVVAGHSALRGPGESVGSAVLEVDAPPIGVGQRHPAGVGDPGDLHGPGSSEEIGRKP